MPRKLVMKKNVLGGEKITVEEACVSIHMFIAKVKLNLKLGLRRSQLQL